MENHILAERIANAIMMDRNFTGHHLIVEGIKDYKLYSKFFNKNVRITEAFGFEKVINSLEILRQRNFTRRLGIIDSDFNKILNINHKVDYLLTTDDHDIEVMIIKTAALTTTIRILCSRKKVQDFESKTKKPVKDHIFDLGKEIGLLKLTNKIFDLGLVFKPNTQDGNLIKYRDFIDDSSFDFKGKEKMIESIINYSRNKSKNIKTKEYIIECLNKTANTVYEIEQLVNGHDLSNIIFLLIKKVFSSTNKMAIDFNSIEDSLILAYEYEDFKSTQLYSAIRNMENNLSISLLR